MKKNTYIRSLLLISCVTLASAWFSPKLSFMNLSLVSSAQAANSDSDQIREMNFTDDEFTELLIRSFAQDKNGALLLSVSELITAQVQPDKITLTAVINLNKVEQVSPEARKNIEKVNGFLLFLDRENLELTVHAQPVLRNGLLGIRDTFSIELGPLPVSNYTLRQLGVPVQKAKVTNLKLDGITAKSIRLAEGLVTLTVMDDAD